MAGTSAGVSRWRRCGWCERIQVVNESHEGGHHDLWRRIGNTLLTEYQATVGSNYLDSGTKGRKGEGLFRDWLAHWLPKCVTVLEGVIVSQATRPTTQRDVIVFDTNSCPVFRDRLGERETLNILPIEGVVGTIEVNTSLVKTEKLLKDFAKISEVKSLRPQEELPKLRALGPKDLEGWSLFREYHPQAIKIGYVFANDSEVSLRTISDYLREHNRRVGVENSVDGVLVLQKGVILHCIESGWTTSRQQGTKLAYQPVEPWDVLLTLVSLLIQHLRLGARGTLPSLEEYFNPPGSPRKAIMVQNRVLVDDTAYEGQAIGGHWTTFQ